MAECPQILKERQLLKIDPLELDFSSKGFVDGILVNYPIIGKVNIAKHYFLCSCEHCEIYRQHTANEGFRLNSLKLLFAREGKQKKVLVPPKTIVKTIQFYFVERLFKGDSVNIEKYLLNKNFLPQGSLQSIITEGLCSINFKGDFDIIRIDFNFDHIDEFLLDREEKNKCSKTIMKRLDDYEAKIDFKVNLDLLDYELRNWDRHFQERSERNPPHEVCCVCDKCKKQWLKNSLICNCEKCIYDRDEELFVKTKNRLFEPLVDSYAKIWEYSEKDIYDEKLLSLETNRVERLNQKRASRQKNKRKNKRAHLKKRKNEC